MDDPRSPDPVKQPIQVLLVEDDPDDAELVRGDLRSTNHHAFTVTHVHRLAEALERLDQAPVDVVLLDLMLPDATGLDTLLGVHRRAPTVPIVVMTGMSDEALGVAAVQAGAQDYLVKGRVDGDLLVRSIRYAIERQRVEAARQEEASVAAALVRVGQDLIACLDTTRLLDRLCQTATEVLECDCSHTFLWQIEENLYAPIAGYGSAPEQWEALRVVKFPVDAQGGLLAKLEHDEVVPIAVGKPEELLGQAVGSQYGIAVGLYMALRRGGRIFGIQTAGYRARHQPFNGRQVRIARGIAQLASLVLEHTLLVEELERANRLKSEFVATMSHELRTPLHIIIGYLELLRSAAFGALSREQSETVTRAEKNAQRLLELITATLNVSRIEAGQVRLEPRPVQLAELCREIDIDAHELAEAGGPTLTWQVSPDLPVVYTDPTKLKVIVTNLIGNALKFTARGSVTVTVGPNDEGIEIAVTDTGIGIPPEALGFIFEPFRQVDGSTTRPYPGVGLGLYIVRRLVDLLHGTVNLESEVGRGSTFRVWIPRIPRGIP